MEIYAKSRKRFGAYKIQQRLLAEYGINISIGRVYRLMKTMQLPKMSTIKPRQIPNLTEDYLDYPNLLQKKFDPTAPNQVWVSDITYIRVDNRFCYVCAIIDLFARKLIACKAGNKSNSGLVVSAFNTAYHDRGSPSGVLFHSDRGCQYTSMEFRKVLDNVNFVQSFSAKAHPFDNAVAESFFKYLKHEELNRKSFHSIEGLNLSLFEYSHFYNTQRPHSFNDGLTPVDMELIFYANS